MTRDNPPRVELRAMPDSAEASHWSRKSIYLENGTGAIGYCGLSPMENPGRGGSGTAHSLAGGRNAEIHFGLDPAQRGRGYAAQAVRQCLEQAFAAGVETVYAGIEGGNAKAIALVIKLGFGIEGERRNPKSGKNEILFSLEKNRP